jgi:hypothetical protein
MTWQFLKLFSGLERGFRNSFLTTAAAFQMVLAYQNVSKA